MVEFIIFSILVLAIFFILYQKINQQNQVNLEQQRAIQEIKEKLLLGSQLQDHLKEGIEKTRDLIEELRKSEEVRREREREFLERIKRIDEIIAGTSTKGISGEEILRETFKKLPPEMIETNFQVRGKVVEFALILPNGKRLPIDSKWVAGKLILDLEKETNPQKKKEIIEGIEKEVIRRIKEVKQYIDPDLTWSQAIAAVPDSVYAVCKNAHLKAREENVILMPYSMVLPLLLYIYRFHLQYAISLDLENLQNHLISIAKNLDEMEKVLENKIYRGAAMVSNAYLEYKQLISRIKSSIEELKLKGSNEVKKLK
jgi:DNA recombination protein RmuC